MASQTTSPPLESRQQVAALPHQAGEDGWLVMLVTSRETGRWVLPKGWAKKRLTHAEAAAQEAFEEAGLMGDIAPTPIGQYRYAKRLDDGGSIDCLVAVFPMRVTELLADWPERAQRQRRWFTLAEAASAVEEAELKALLLDLAATGATRIS